MNVLKTAMARLVLATVMAGVVATSAHANVVVYEDVGFIRGAGYLSESFTVADDGVYRASLTDFQFPSYFDELQFTITTYRDELGSVSGAGWFDFEAKAGTTYFASVYGVGGGTLDLGLYGVGVEALTAPASAVPVPASLWLLSSALVGLAALRRRGSGFFAGRTIPGVALP